MMNIIVKLLQNYILIEGYNEFLKYIPFIEPGIHRIESIEILHVFDVDKLM